MNCSTAQVRRISLHCAAVLFVAGGSLLVAQTDREKLAAKTAEDHQDMMNQLGIQALRPGPSGNEEAPNHANYDEATANPYPNLPDPLTMDNGQKVTTAKQWWEQRRPQIIEDFEREVLGRVPASVPPVKWEVVDTVEAEVAGKPVIGKQLRGHVDNSGDPAIEVNIDMSLVVPANAKAPVPVMMMFGRRPLPGTTEANAKGKGKSKFAPPAGSDPPATEQLIAAGWGYAYLNPTSVQADNGAGLTEGIIGLVNKGQRRKPED